MHKGADAQAASAEKASLICQSHTDTLVSCTCVRIHIRGTGIDWYIYNIIYIVFVFLFFRWCIDNLAYIFLNLSFNVPIFRQLVAVWGRWWWWLEPHAGKGTLAKAKTWHSAPSQTEQTLCISDYIYYIYIYYKSTCLSYFVPSSYKLLKRQQLQLSIALLFQSHQLSITALRSTHLLSFGFCHVASLHISRSFHFPDHIFAFLMGCASRFAAKNNPLNFVPPLHEFFWLSDACIQIKWHSPTPSSPSFLAWRWLRCWRKT